MADTSRIRVVVIATAVLAVAVLSLAWLGLTQVPEGQVMALPDGSGGVAGVWQPGWHWRAPWSAEPLPLPSEALAADRDVELTTTEGARITVEVAGRFAIADGGEKAWVDAAGWRPFLDGLGTVLTETLSPEARSADPAAVFEEPRLAALATLARRALEDAGVAVEEITLAAPMDKNPVAVAAARNKVAALARPTNLKVLLVGWDGADWLMIKPLLAQGKLPNVAKLVRDGVSGELRSQEPMLSPLIWTSIATGKTVAEHGIADFLVTDPESGEMVPISSAARRVHALWTLLPAFGKSSDTVAWWATWPAEPVDGTMVTDRVAYQLIDIGAAAQDPSGKVYPESAWPNVEDKLVAAEDVGWDMMHRFVDLTPQELEEHWSSLPPERRQEDKVNHLRKILAATESYQAIALSLLEHQADLTMVYFEGTDTVGHRFARYLPPRLPAVTQEEVDKYGGALPAYYELADELLGQLMDAAGDDTLVLLVSDHGFFTGEARPESDPADFTGGAPDWHRLYGVIAGEGPGVEHGEVTGASIFDVAPTILAALGLPVPEDMQGRVLSELLPPQARSVLPQLTGTLASYEVLPRQRVDAVRVASEDDEQRLRELVALGYISQAALEQNQGAGKKPAGGDAGGGSRTVPSQTAASITDASGSGTGGPGDLHGLATESYNLGRIAQREGRLDDAERYYRQAVERMPSFAPGYTMQAQVASVRGEHSRSFDLLVEGFTKSGEMPQGTITGMVEEGSKAGRMKDVERVLEGLRASRSDDAAYYGAWGMLAEKRGDPTSALQHYERALAIDPVDHLAVEQKIALLLQLGRPEEAQRFLETAFARARSVSDMNQMALIALRQGWAGSAEKLLRRVLESDPGNPGVLANLAASLARQGKMDEAARVMRQAVERDPTNASNYFNLGAMLAALGHPEEALAAFEQAAAKGLASPQVHVAAAKMHFRLGDPAAAERELRRALEISPSDPEARELLDVLQQGAG